jgi:hypothetical protein
MKRLLGALLLSATLITVYTGCDKDDGDDNTAIPAPGTGGSGEISAYVRNHSTQALIPAARIFVKFGASAFPGADSTLYDAA